VNRATLILVRHGETEGESSIRYHGRSDVPLSELGRSQMRAARAAIERDHGGLAFAHVFTSPLSRAVEGARIIAGDSAPLVIFEEFAEVHFGEFEGLTREEICLRFPEEFERWRRDPISRDYTYPGGENRAAFENRVERGVEQMLAIWANPQGPPERALLVAHRGVIRTVAMRLTGTQPEIELGSIHVLELDGTWRAVALDLIDHLRAV